MKMTISEFHKRSAAIRLLQPADFSSHRYVDWPKLSENRLNYFYSATPAEREAIWEASQGIIDMMARIGKGNFQESNQ